MAVLQRSLDSSDGAFLDVGANLGQTLIKVLALDPARIYVGFEPQVECCFFINQFLKDNALHNAKVMPIALSDENRMVPLFWNTAYDEMASIAAEIDAEGRTRGFADWVPARLGDEVIEELELDRIAVIKIDVEGAEFQVLSGLARTLREKRPAVIFEVLPNFYGHDRIMLEKAIRRQNGARAEAIHALFKEAGYEVYQIDARGDEHRLEKFDLDDAQGYVGCDYIARPHA